MDRTPLRLRWWPRLRSTGRSVSGPGPGCWTTCATTRGLGSPDRWRPGGSRPALPPTGTRCMRGSRVWAPTLVEVSEARPWTDAEHRLRDGIVDRLSAMVATRSEPSLYDGLAGDATALRMLSPTAAPHALRRLEELRVPGGWVTTLEVSGAAGRCLHDVGDGHCRGRHDRRVDRRFGRGRPGGRRRGRLGQGCGAQRDGPGLGVLVRRRVTPPQLLSRHGRHRQCAGSRGDGPRPAGAGRHRGAWRAAPAGDRSMDNGGFVVPHTIPPPAKRVVER